jgi:hypothetical protein
LPSAISCSATALVTGHAVGLVDRAFVVVQPEPVHRFENGVDGGLSAALAVGVLDAQDELAAAWRASSQQYSAVRAPPMCR